jgi:hypothetical protein
MRKNGKKFLRLSGEEKRRFIEAWLTLGRMRGALLTLPFKRLTRGLHQSGRIGAPPGPGGDGERIAEQVGRAVRRAAAHPPWESACLVQALTAWKMLQRRGVPGVFYLGVAREGARGEMRAHAWTRCGSRILTGAAGREAFTVVSVFAWGVPSGETPPEAPKRGA